MCIHVCSVVSDSLTIFYSHLVFFVEMVNSRNCELQGIQRIVYRVVIVGLVFCLDKRELNVMQRQSTIVGIGRCRHARRIIGSVVLFWW